MRKLSIHPNLWIPDLVQRQGMLRRKTNSTTLLLAVLIGIDVLGFQGARLVTSGTGFFEADLRITTERHALLHARPVVSETPDFPAAGRHVERKPIRVAYRVVIAGDSDLPNGRIRECQSELLNRVKDRCRLAIQAAPAKNRFSAHPNPGSSFGT
jgi:hypothetical protein